MANAYYKIEDIHISSMAQDNNMAINIWDMEIVED